MLSLLGSSIIVVSEGYGVISSLRNTVEKATYATCFPKENGLQIRLIDFLECCFFPEYLNASNQMHYQTNQSLFT